MRLFGKTLLVAFACCAGLVAIGMLAATPCHAGSIPAWLDDGIGVWNKQNPATPLRFVDIRDSYVWYSMPGTPELTAKDIRGKVYGIAYKNGYANNEDEELVTTGRPPSPNGPSGTKKCYTRTFIRDIQKASPTTVERMLTAMICEDGPNWLIGFRIMQ